MNLETPVNGGRPSNSIGICLVLASVHEEAVGSEGEHESLRPAETRIIYILQAAELMSTGFGAEGTNMLSKLTLQTPSGQTAEMVG